MKALIVCLNILRKRKDREILTDFENEEILEAREDVGRILKETWEDRIVYFLQGKPEKEYEMPRLEVGEDDIVLGED